MPTNYLVPPATLQQYVGQMVQFQAGNQHYTGLLTNFDAGSGMATFLIYAPNGQQYTMQFHNSDIIGIGPATYNPTQPGQGPQHPQHPQYPQHPQHPQHPQYPGGVMQFPWWLLGRAYTNQFGHIIITPEQEE